MLRDAAAFLNRLQSPSPLLGSARLGLIGRPAILLVCIILSIACSAAQLSLRIPRVPHGSAPDILQPTRPGRLESQSMALPQLISTSRSRLSGRLRPLISRNPRPGKRTRQCSAWLCPAPSRPSLSGQRVACLPRRWAHQSR
jgi:hypothetical protein